MFRQAYRAIPCLETQLLSNAIVMVSSGSGTTKANTAAGLKAELSSACPQAGSNQVSLQKSAVHSLIIIP